MPNDYLKAELDRLDQKIIEAQASLSDPQLKHLAEEEIIKLEEQKKVLLESQQEKKKELKNEPLGNVILEIRPGAGGEEAKIFALDLENMYTRFALSQGLKVITVDTGMIKIKGSQAYPLFQFEAGGHQGAPVQVPGLGGSISLPLGAGNQNKCFHVGPLLDGGPPLPYSGDRRA